MSSTPTSTKPLPSTLLKILEMVLTASASSDIRNARSVSFNAKLCILGLRKFVVLVTNETPFSSLMLPISFLALSISPVDIALLSAVVFASPRCCDNGVAKLSTASSIYPFQATAESDTNLRIA